MGNITSIPSEDNATIPYWTQTDECAGFEVSSDCPWRYEEMDLVTYTPIECVQENITACQFLVAYARFNKRSEKVSEAVL